MKTLSHDIVNFLKETRLTSFMMDTHDEEAFVKQIEDMLRSGNIFLLANTFSKYLNDEYPYEIERKSQKLMGRITDAVHGYGVEL